MAWQTTQRKINDALWLYGEPSLGNVLSALSNDGLLKKEHSEIEKDLQGEIDTHQEFAVRGILVNGQSLANRLYQKLLGLGAL
jgi:hypothetical protein